MNARLNAAALVLLTLTLAACSNASSAPVQPAAPAAGVTAPTTAPATGTRPRLVFFMNPNGRPCQMQDEILRSMPDLASRAQLVYYRTTEPGDLARFEQYGIRSIPQLVVTDGNGLELRRATPGIQPDAQIRQLLAP
jgi:thioredoxin 1